MSGTKAGRNYAYAWKFATLALVGRNTPITVVSLPVKSVSNLDSVVDRLFRFATAKFDIDWVYLDSEFYQDGVATKVRSEAGFILKGKKGSDKLQEVKEEFLEEDKEGDDFRWGVGEPRTDGTACPCYRKRRSRASRKRNSTTRPTR